MYPAAGISLPLNLIVHPNADITVKSLGKLLKFANIKNILYMLHIFKHTYT
jgi:hypothetical protein